MNLKTISLIGNPNCGKTTLFNALTGAHQHVGNWPGVTVEKKTGYYLYKDKQVYVVDLPGTYSIEGLNEGISDDELVARNFVLDDQNSLMINIIDSSNLQRNLYLTFQLLELGKPMIVVLNMIDEINERGEKIDFTSLQRKLGCPVVAVSASKKYGIDTLLKEIDQALQTTAIPAPTIPLLNEQEEFIIKQAKESLSAESQLTNLSRWDWLELLLHGTDSTSLSVEDNAIINHCRQQIAEPYGNEIDIALASARYETIDALSRQVLSRPRQASQTLTNSFDRWALGRFSGIPIFLFMMYLMFMFAMNFGSAFIDFFDQLSATLFVDGTAHILNQINAPNWLITVLAYGLGSGVQTVSTFIPVIGAMFLCLSFLEDSGYLARAAVVVDRGMQAIGLPGKAFVPMLVGFGCNVPAIMGTRTLESSRDRLMSIMMIPYMSCSARLPVYALFVAVFFPMSGQNVVFGLYLLGIAVAVITGLVLKYTLLPGKTTPFIMELPPYRMPTMENLFALTWEKLKSFVIRAGKAIIFMVLILSILNSLGTDGSFGNQDNDKSVLSVVSQKVTPILSPMGIENKNWPATVGIFTGLFAKEAVIGTINSLYSQMGIAEGNAESEGVFDFGQRVKDAFATIPENIIALKDNLLDPFGISATLADGHIETVQQDNGVDDNTVKTLQLMFNSKASVIAYLIFILLYTPCAAALGAVYREAGGRWTSLIAVWSMATAWITATGFYQISMLNSQPVTSISWLIGLVVIVSMLILLLKYMGRKQQKIVMPIRDNLLESKGCH